MATTAMGFPFTAAQWKELERQAMIYKYMMASLPVPPDLLYSSLPTNLPSPATFPPASCVVGKYESGGLNLTWSTGNSKDAEPGRCRRTDGKKWRCSRDVAPNHKYCERHMHRGRPRSRKPVELVNHHCSLSDFPIITTNYKKKNNKKTRLDGSSPQPQPLGSSLPLIPLSKASTFGHPIDSGANPFEVSRSLAWNEEQQWQQLVQANMDSLAFQQQYEGLPMNLNSQADFSSKSDMGLLERPFIDAWSMGVAGSKNNDGSNKSSVMPSKGSRGNATTEDVCQIHMGLGAIEAWLVPPTSPGGPLAEVLRPSLLTGTSTSALNQAASDAGVSALATPPATAVSSPSGVLQKNLASVSDSSGSNSPTCQNSKANSDMPFHWLS